jgi:hypothetical protein
MPLSQGRTTGRATRVADTTFEDDEKTLPREHLRGGHVDEHA